MNGANDELARRRRQLRFRSWHRGTREMDLLLGRFADAHLDAFGSGQLDLFARLLENSDPDIYDWIGGQVPVPADRDSEILRLLRDFTLGRGRT
jgi:antitoxin CptB